MGQNCALACVQSQMEQIKIKREGIVMEHLPFSSIMLCCWVTCVGGYLCWTQAGVQLGYFLWFI